MDYRGTLVDGTEFDSSYKRGEPATFPVTGVIRGWVEALQLMKEGGRWQLFIPAELAYGKQGPLAGRTLHLRRQAPGGSGSHASGPARHRHKAGGRATLARLRLRPAMYRCGCVGAGLPALCLRPRFRKRGQARTHDQAR